MTPANAARYSPDMRRLSRLVTIALLLLTTGAARFAAKDASATGLADCSDAVLVGP